MVWNLEEAMKYYGKQGAPADQTALIGLLREIQQENGGSIPPGLLVAVAEGYGVRESLLHAIIRRIPSLRLGNRHTLELCAGPNCGKSRELAAFARELCGKNPERVELKYVPCMRMCGKGPNIRWDGRLLHRADRTMLLELVENSKKSL